MNHRRARLAVAAGLIVVAACSPSPSAPVSPAPTPSATSPGAGATTPDATPRATLDRVGGWRDDLVRIVPGLERIHPDPFHGTPKVELEAAVAALSATVATSSDDELMVGVLRIAALVSAAGCDGHTGAFVWGTGTYPVDSLPLRLWLFGEEVVIVDALPPLEGLVGARIDSVEGRPIADVVAALDPLVPRDNEQTVRLLLPRYLLIPQVLRGLGIATDGPIELGLTAAAGTTSSEAIEPIPMADYNAWAGPYGLHLPADPDVPYLSRMDEALWLGQPDGQEALYIQYNRADHLSAAVLAGLRSDVAAASGTPIVLDVRHNVGGEVSALDPIVAIFSDHEVVAPEDLFVITGRNTFSAGSLLVARLDAAGAVIVGEPMGGCPTFFGDVSEVRLPHSGLSILVSGMLEVGVDPNDTRATIPLDVEAELTQEDWQAGRDPALELFAVAAP